MITQTSVILSMQTIFIIELNKEILYHPGTI